MAAAAAVSGKVVHLEVENFKSYKGRHVIGPFRQFQAVIGPNGSGKSNIMDAISFVLGVRSTHLRGLHLRDLVYKPSDSSSSSSSAAAAAQLKASVKLVFQTSDGEVIAFQRTVLAGGGSEYRVDGAGVSERDYGERLKRLGVLVKARNFLVFQGDVGSLASRTGAELTRLFEQISGSGELAAEYDAALAEKARAEEATIFAWHKKKGLGAEKRQYRAMRDEAQHYERLSAELSALRRDLGLVQLRHLSRGTEKIGADAARAQAQADDVRARLATSERAAAAKRAEQAAAARREADLRKRLRREQAAADKLAADAIHAREGAAHAKARAERSAAALAELDKETRAREAEAAAIRGQLAEVERARGDFERAAAEEEARASVALTPEQRAKFARVEDAARKQAASIRAELDRVVRECEERREARAALQMRQDECTTRRAQLEDIRAKQERRKERVEQFRAEVQRQLEDARTRLAELREHTGADERSRAALERELAQVDEQVRALRLDKREEEREERVRELVASLRSAFPGVRGRLFELSRTVKPRYNVAATVALGKYMDAIVVDNDETARECIRYMKEQRTGVATFLPLASLRVKPVREGLRQSLGPGVRLAVDVITCDGDVQIALQFVLGSTLVAESLDEARRICFGGRERLRCVTVDGALIEKSGLMSGGSSGVEQRAARWNERELSEAKRKKDRIMRELTDVTARLRHAANEDQLGAQIASAEERLRYCDVDRKAVDERLASIMRDLTGAIAEEQGLQPEAQRLDEAVRTLEERAAELRARVDGVVGGLWREFEAEVGIPGVREAELNRAARAKEISDRRVELSGAVAKLRSQLEFEMSRDLDGPRQRLTRAVSDAKTALEHARATEIDCKKQSERTNARMAELHDQEAKLKREAEDRELEAKELERAVASDAAQLRALQRQISGFDAQLTRLALRRHDVLQRIRVEQLELPIVSGNEEMLQASSGSEPLDSAEAQERESRIVFDFSKLPEVANLREYEDLCKKLGDRTRAVETELSGLAPNLKAMEHLDGVAERLEQERTHFEESRAASRTAAERFARVKRERNTRFMRAFEAVSAAIDDTYKQLTRSAANPVGGTAYLSLDSDEEPYLHGVKYSAMPPLKRFHDLEQLSGGEKTMAALALLFAVQRYQPAPFVVLDEIDAPLDTANSVQVARYLRDQAHNGGAQCIVISLKDSFFEKADALIGVARDTTEHSSVTYTLDLSPYDA